MPLAAPTVSWRDLLTKYRALGFAAAAALVLCLPPELVAQVLHRVETNGPVLLKLGGAYLGFRAAWASSPKDAPPADLPPAPDDDYPAERAVLAPLVAGRTEDDR